MLKLNAEPLTRFQGDAVEGTVSFGAPDDFGTRFLPNILARFAKTHPSVEVNVSSGTSANMLRQLASAALDLTIVTTCQGQLAALMADLPVAPLPLSLLGPGFERLDLKRDLPLLQNYEVRLLEHGDFGRAGKDFDPRVVDSFAELAGA
ncbi:MAG: LysR substrate-binding domain-containing protein [Burkholderiaceae bacterium]